MPTVNYRHSAIANRAAALLPVAYLLHVAEEWFGGFTTWTLTALGNEISPERFLLINTIAFLLFSSGTLASCFYPRMAWFSTMFAALLGLNGALHALATLGFGYYSPGTITGLVLYIPLSAIVLRSSATKLSPVVLIRSVLLGVLLHGLVAFLAFL